MQLADEPKQASTEEPDASARVAANARECFFSTSMKIALALYGVFALTFSYFQIKGDALVYFNLLRRFFGEYLPEGAVAYQFGSALWNAPFFLVGKALASVWGHQPRIFHVSFQEISITVAANAAFVLTLYFAWRILQALDLPRGPGVLFLTAFGTPLFYYVVFDPAGKHAVDTLVLTAAAYFLLRAELTGAWRAAAVAGALAGWSVNIRWVNAGFFIAVAVVLLLRGRFRQLGIASMVAAAVGPLIFALPAMRGIPYHFGGFQFPPWREAHLAASELIAVEGLGLTHYDPTIPFKMLVSEHRGLFAWTPLAAFAAVGFLVALGSALRRRENAGFLVALLAGATVLLGIHGWWNAWDGGFAFSQRFLTGLFPLYVIGIAELVRRARFVVYPLLVLSVFFSVAIAFVHDIGYDAISERDGLARHVEAGWEGRRALRLDVQDDAKARWVYLWGLLEGRDSKCIHEPPGTTEC